MRLPFPEAELPDLRGRLRVHRRLAEQWVNRLVVVLNNYELEGGVFAWAARTAGSRASVVQVEFARKLADDVLPWVRAPVNQGCGGRGHKSLRLSV